MQESYALLSFTNPVPDADADGKLTKSATVTVDATNDVSDYDLLTMPVTRTA